MSEPITTEKEAPVNPPSNEKHVTASTVINQENEPLDSQVGFQAGDYVARGLKYRW